MRHRLEFLSQMKVLSEKFFGDSAEQNFQKLTEPKAKECLRLINEMWTILDRRAK